MDKNNDIFDKNLNYNFEFNTKKTKLIKDALVEYATINFEKDTKKYNKFINLINEDISFLFSANDSIVDSTHLIFLAGNITEDNNIIYINEKKNFIQGIQNEKEDFFFIKKFFIDNYLIINPNLNYFIKENEIFHTRMKNLIKELNEIKLMFVK